MAEEYLHEQLDDSPLRGSWQTINFPNAAVLLAFYNEDIAAQKITLHKWQVKIHEDLVEAKGTQTTPHKFCLVTCNGSGKDAFIIAPWAIFFALCKRRSRTIITSSSGTQLSSQTEGYIRDLAERVNKFHGEEIFRIRQRFIFCKLSGSEIRLFATDEKGRAEGYHPIEPNAEMCIIVNEGKTVSEEIHGALRRCTGYNYWLEVSSPGEPYGFFFNSFKHWKHVVRVTTFDCPHLPKEEVEYDKMELGEHSALFRSKHLALFTTIGGNTIIPMEVVNSCLESPPKFTYSTWTKKRVGLDIAAGGDENALCVTLENKVLKELQFREVDTEITADRIDRFLKDEKVVNGVDEIYADDGGVGHAVIDKLVRKGWNINRVLNQWASTNKRMYGNKGAELWYRVKRILEESLFDITKLSKTTIEQLTTRQYKQQGLGGRIFLESKKDAKACGRPSPDRADAFILTFCGLSLDDFLLGKTKNLGEEAANSKLRKYTPEEIEENWDEIFSDKKHSNNNRRVYNSLSSALDI
jgi:hypothetical protein